jgi:hypothetical protein
MFSEAILCLMGLFENPLSKKTPDGENILEARAEFKYC